MNHMNKVMNHMAIW